MDNVIEYTSNFKEWFEVLDKKVRKKIIAHINLLREQGVALSFPYSSAINGSEYPLRELRVQCDGHPIRIFYAFDPRRSIIVLLRGDKTSDKRFYDKFIPIAEKLYDDHIEQLKQERLI